MHRLDFALAFLAARQTDSAVSSALSAYPAKTIFATSDGLILRVTEALHFSSPFFSQQRATHSNARDALTQFADFGEQESRVVQKAREPGSKRGEIPSKVEGPPNPQAQLERGTLEIASGVVG